MDLNYNIINKSSIILLVVLVSILIVYVIIYIIYYIFIPCDTDKEFNLNMSNICPKSTLPVPSQSFIQRELEREKEVFHINNQKYTYKQAKKKCEVYNSKLATKEQITKAYNKGANWCSYGWSEGQNAYYPVQKCMQEGCGKAGINGGFFNKENLKFGVNCYGIKPSNNNIVPKSIYCKEKPFCQKENNKKSCKKLKSDIISSFNNDRWSMYKS